jgi:hypothetical protein
MPKFFVLVLFHQIQENTSLTIILTIISYSAVKLDSKASYNGHITNS